MTPQKVLQELKQIKEGRLEAWTFPLRLGPCDAIAAELIEIAMQRLGDDAESSQLLGVAAAMFWWTQTILALEEPELSGYASKDSSVERVPSSP